MDIRLKALKSLGDSETNTKTKNILYQEKSFIRPNV